jgi:hypothetical protein
LNKNGIILIEKLKIFIESAKRTLELKQAILQHHLEQVEVVVLNEQLPFSEV